MPLIVSLLLRSDAVVVLFLLFHSFVFGSWCSSGDSSGILHEAVLQFTPSSRVGGNLQGDAEKRVFTSGGQLLPQRTSQGRKSQAERDEVQRVLDRVGNQDLYLER